MTSLSPDDLRVCTWKWSQPNYRSKFTAEHVNTLASMVRRFYNGPHEFVCFTDESAGIHPSIRVEPLPPLYSDMVSPHGPSSPSCYRRLFMFSKEAEHVIGKRFVALDLDTVIVSDVGPLWNRREDFVIWGDTALRTYYNGSMLLMKAGSCSQVWETFNPVESPKETRRRGMTGSDQAWISLCLGQGQAKWTTHDGVYSFRNHINTRHRAPLPKNARIVFFHGSWDPWMPTIQQSHTWVKRYYRQSPAKLLLLGNSPTVWDEVRVARELMNPDLVIAVDKVGVTWPHDLDHWIVRDDVNLSRWLEDRRRNKLPKVQNIWCLSTTRRTSIPVRTIGSTDFRQSVISLACDLADKIVIAGTPFDHDGAPRHKQLRSVAVDSQQYFGLPDASWLEAW